jgi:hypothetical protein
VKEFTASPPTNISADTATRVRFIVFSVRSILSLRA